MDYNSRRWAAKRSSILKRDRYRCRECRRFGEAVDASVVHHVWPVENWPEYAWYSWNLISLCASCHNAMHDRETRALTDKGMAWRRRIPPPSSGRSLTLSGDRGAGPFPTEGKTGEGVKGGAGKYLPTGGCADAAPANDRGAKEAKPGCGT